MTRNGKLIYSFLFFCLLFFHTRAHSFNHDLSLLTQRIDQLNLYDDPLWHTLLELKENTAINPERHSLSGTFEPRDEMLRTLDAFFFDTQAVCRYPARLRFLQRHLAELSSIEFSSTSGEVCQAYVEYIYAVPNDTLYLVYAAENVTAASSMMGHAMLRLDGVNSNGLRVKHGATFFTELNTLNIPHLLYETLITGKEGIFKVAPYAPYQHFYRVTEQRNVWEYKLALTSFQKDLIRDRIWELQFENPDYFFDKYNCATLTNLLLAIARPETTNSLDRLITPLDVVRFTEHHQLSASVRLIPSDKWEVRSLSQNLSLNTRELLVQDVKNGSIQSINEMMDADDFLQHKYLSSLNALLRANEEISVDIYDLNSSQISKNQRYAGDLSISVNDDVSPLLRAEESHVSAGIQYYEDEEFLTLSYYPVANSLRNNNRSTFGETQLILADVKLRFSPQDGDTYIDDLSIYNMVSRVPFELESQDISTSFYVGATRIPDQHLKRLLLGKIEIAGGITKDFSSSLGFYAELGAGITSDLDRISPFISPRVGSYAYFINNLKLNVEYRLSYNSVGEDERLHDFNAQLIYYPETDYHFSFKAGYLDGESNSSTFFEIQAHYLF